MWSLGTITAILLTGNLIFAGTQDDKDDWESRQSKLRAAAQCDLSMIDRNEGEWSLVNKRAKDFVKSLLVLDENRRASAKQALQHPWLTNRHYAGILEAIYKRAVGDWTPRDKDRNIVQLVDTSDIAAATPLRPSRDQSPVVRSTHFGSLYASAARPPSFSSSSSIPFQNPTFESSGPSVVQQHANKSMTSLEKQQQQQQQQKASARQPTTPNPPSQYAQEAVQQRQHFPTQQDPSQSSIQLFPSAVLQHKGTTQSHSLELGMSYTTQFSELLHADAESLAPFAEP